LNLKIKEIPQDERPRERLLCYGVEQLSNEELLAILLKTGTRDMSAKVLASYLLKEIGNISELQHTSYQVLAQMKGIGRAKACTLLAAVELGKRVLQKKSILYQKFTDAYQVASYYQDKIGHFKQEYFICIYLDVSKKLIHEKVLFIGTLNRSLVHPREVFKEAYQVSASSIICVHNHPSGEVLPSKEDVLFTSQLVKVGKMLGIEVIDHIIIGEDKYYSFFENNRIAL
jgi:DNA repair protein RadC